MKKLKKDLLKMELWIIYYELLFKCHLFVLVRFVRFFLWFLLFFLALISHNPFWLGTLFKTNWNELIIIIIISKYFMPFCLISWIIRPRQEIFNAAKRSWILPYRGWIILILNKKLHGIFVLLYTSSTKQKVGEC